MTTTKTRLVFGSKEAQEIVAQSKKDEQRNKIKRELKSIENKLENLSELTGGVEASVGEFSESLWAVADWVNTLMIDLKEEYTISNITDEAYNTWDDMINRIVAAVYRLDTDNPSQAYDILSEALQASKYQPQFKRLDNLTNNFTH